MKLYHRDQPLGEITDVAAEGPWMSGTIALDPGAEGYVPFFRAMTDEDRGFEDPPFGEDLLDPEGWTIEDGGRRRGIEVPAVHDDGTIDWRWR